ncbi:MAG: transglutaminase domain-containing protein [Candidatus Theseobacter exili]|nr:transglutaminase domain-containing protein [Candidatus Theseobacter exili]
MIIRVVVFLCALCVICGFNEAFSSKEEEASYLIVVTEEIQDGIENYIEERIEKGGGYFVLPFDDKELRLKLVRVHTEYLAHLSFQHYFACVDLVDISGDVYDVDFFLAGKPGAMTVIETTVHKINGQPYYAWEQKNDKTWHRIPIENADQNHLGVLRDSDEFDFFYKAELPKLTEKARIWIPLADSDQFQTVEITSIEVPGKQKILDEKNHGNRILFLELEPEDSGKIIDIRYHVKRLEKSAYPVKTKDLKKYLNPERLVPEKQEFEDIAMKVVEGKKTDLVRARALYDHVIDRMSYIKYGTGWGKGDAVYACDAKTGNCTDFHSYFIALARSAGIPARFAIGAAIPSSRNNGGADGYHCWAEFYADGKWWPVDISEGDKYSSLATYYFGHHPANRFELSRGRDLVVEPGPDSGPINFLAYPILEIGGKPEYIKPKFTFERIAATNDPDSIN